MSQLLFLIKIKGKKVSCEGTTGIDLMFNKPDAWHDPDVDYFPITA